MNLEESRGKIIKTIIFFKFQLLLCFNVWESDLYKFKTNK